MVDVAMAEDYREDRFSRPVLIIKFETGLGTLRRQKCVGDDDSSITFDDSHIREVETAHLVNAVGDLKQAVEVVQLCLPPQTRIHSRRSVPLFESVSLHIPNRALFGADPPSGNGSYEATLRGFEVFTVCEREFTQYGLVRRLGGGFRWFGRCWLSRRLLSLHDRADARGTETHKRRCERRRKPESRAQHSEFWHVEAISRADIFLRYWLDRPVLSATELSRPQRK